jgi:serine/threonine protein kinase
MAASDSPEALFRRECVSETPCPSAEALFAFVIGTLPEAAIAEIERHLNQCPACELAAQSLEGVSDPLIGGPRRRSDPTDVAAPPSAQPAPGRGTSHFTPGAANTPQRQGQGLAPVDAPASPWPTPAGYEILGELGRGGMGIVYEARHLALQRTVALKMMVRSGGKNRAEELRRFRQEALAAARLQHPNIVQIFEVGDHEGQPYCALEHVAGGSLAQHLAGTPLPPRPAAELLEGLARAMHYAHQQGIVHRDLKPANILLAVVGCRLSVVSKEPQLPSSLTTDNRQLTTAKITDFGLARQLDSDSGQTSTGVVMGTPQYMAPEQAVGQAASAGPAADVYALGTILYECLTGRPPFKAATVLETLEQVRSQEPVPAPGSPGRRSAPMAAGC